MAATVTASWGAAHVQTLVGKRWLEAIHADIHGRHSASYLQTGNSCWCWPAQFHAMASATNAVSHPTTACCQVIRCLMQLYGCDRNIFQGHGVWWTVSGLFISFQHWQCEYSWSDERFVVHVPVKCTARGCRCLIACKPQFVALLTMCKLHVVMQFCCQNMNMPLVHHAASTVVCDKVVKLPTYTSSKLDLTCNDSIQPPVQHTS